MWLTYDQTILQEGAKELGLPEGYQQYLSTIVPYTPSSQQLNKLGAGVFLSVGRIVVSKLARKVKGSTNAEGRCPEWYGTLVRVAYTSMWWWHDYVFAIMFGRGDGGELRYGSLHLLE